MKLFFNLKSFGSKPSPSDHNASEVDASDTESSISSIEGIRANSNSSLSGSPSGPATKKAATTDGVQPSLQSFTTVENRNRKVPNRQKTKPAARSSQESAEQETGSTAQIAESNREARQRDVEKRTVILDDLSPAFRTEEAIEAELKRVSNNGIAFNRMKLLDKGGVRLTLTTAEMANKVIDLDGWPLDAFGGNIRAHRSSLFYHLFPEESPPAKVKHGAKEPDNRQKAQNEGRAILCTGLPSSLTGDQLKESWAEYIEDAVISFDKGKRVIICYMKTAELAKRLTKGDGLRWNGIRVVKGFEMKAKPNPARCNVCQNHNHATRQCKATAPKCGWCAGDHYTKFCPKLGDDAARRCANCNGTHSSGYHGCKAVKQAIEKLMQLEQDKLNRAIGQSAAPESRSYKPAPQPSKNSWQKPPNGTNLNDDALQQIADRIVPMVVEKVRQQILGDMHANESGLTIKIDSLANSVELILKMLRMHTSVIAPEVLSFDETNVDDLQQRSPAAVTFGQTASRDKACESQQVHKNTSDRKAPTQTNSALKGPVETSDAGNSGNGKIEYNLST